MNELQEIQEITDEAIDTSFEHSNRSWREMALECVKTVCLSKEFFTMNDVRKLVNLSDLKTHDNRAMGGIIKTARKLNWIEPTGQEIVSRVGHKSPLQVWKSTLYQSF